MYLRILKKDLTRKKTMNVILLVFILLASLFVASSVNNILAIVNGVDGFLELAGVPELMAITIENNSGNTEHALDEIEQIESYVIEPMLFVNPDNVLRNGEELEDMTSSGFLHAFGKSGMKFFDMDNQVITGVEPGEILLSAYCRRYYGIAVGEELELRFGNQSKTVTVAGFFKDATGIGARFLVNEQDYVRLADADYQFRGSTCYITTGDVDAVEAALNQSNTNILFIGGHSKLKTAYIMDMIIAGILLLVSVCLILISFVVLQFTISFSLTEEYRQIGVMKAIGIPNLRIRLLYMAKYFMIAVAGAVIGFFGSVPFSDMLLDTVSEAMVLGGSSSLVINGLCSACVVAVTLVFCFGCTRKVKRFTPVDAIRSGTTGERFRKKGILHLSKSPVKPALFMALNDVLSSPRRFGMVIATFALCLSLVLMLVTSVNTLKSDGLVTAFGITQSDLFTDADVSASTSEGVTSYFSENGRQMILAELEEMEAALKQQGMQARCCTEVAASLTLVRGENTHKCYVYQGVGTTAEQYDYYKGTPPQNANEIAVTKLVAEKLDADIGDTIAVRQMEGDREYIITAFFQSMMNMGECIRLHESAQMSYEQLTGIFAFQIDFADDPDEAETEKRIGQIKQLFDTQTVLTAGEYVEDMVGIVDTLNGVRTMVLGVVLVVVALVTVLMEHSFITRERSEIAIVKAVGFSDSSIIRWHTLRFGIVAVIAAVISLATLIPAVRLSIGPIFTYMGADFGISYVIKPVEVYFVYPVVVLTVTMVSAFVTAQNIRTVSASECSNIE